jgi:hypothetical protein
MTARFALINRLSLSISLQLGRNLVKQVHQERYINHRLFLHSFLVSMLTILACVSCFHSDDGINSATFKVGESHKKSNRKKRETEKKRTER